MKVILDTSVIVSGLFSPKGTPAQIIGHWMKGSFTLLYTQSMLTEYDDVLQRAWLTERLAHVPDRVPEFLTAVIGLGEQVKGYVNVAGAVRDPFDEMFLACAILGEADYLVSVDKDLLTLQQIQRTVILMPGEFLPLIQ
ncbi:MAG TPA: putative toxin-antitoxin system toxin component, PIN family [Anaerolineae bacterium]|nr:putative toxin-antitoxin system toxin component, PIN family [Anaerolineae bacterium]